MTRGERWMQELVCAEVDRHMGDLLHHSGFTWQQDWNLLSLVAGTIYHTQVWTLLPACFQQFKSLFLADFQVKQQLESQLCKWTWLLFSPLLPVNVSLPCPSSTTLFHSWLCQWLLHPHLQAAFIVLLLHICKFTTTIKANINTPVLWN